MKIATLAAMLALAVAGAAAQDTPPPPPPMNDEMMKFIEATSPNANHKKLEPFVGRWDIESSFWMEGPDKPPMTSRGSANITWALGGRFIKQEFKGSFMGMPMEGIGYTGYDNLRKNYSMVWIDNTATAMSLGTGQFDEAGTTLTMTGKGDDPLSGQMDKTVRYVLRSTEKGRFVFEMYDVPEKGAATKVGEMVYTKAKEHN